MKPDDITPSVSGFPNSMVGIINAAVRRSADWDTVI